MDFGPTWSGGDILSVVLCAPSLHEGQTESAHFDDVVDCLDPQGYGLMQHACEFMVGEYLQGAAWRDLDDSGRVKTMALIAQT